jgi:hypothetical protein
MFNAVHGHALRVIPVHANNVLAHALHAHEVKTPRSTSPPPRRAHPRHALTREVKAVPRYGYYSTHLSPLFVAEC